MGDKPFITHEDGLFHAHCLNGGAWDRPLWLGEAATYEAACELARERQAEWEITRNRPRLLMLGANSFQVVQEAHGRIKT